MTHWDKFAKQWDNIHPPLRPSNIDIKYYEETVNHFCKSPSALILGVTPEIALMNWPKNSKIYAADKCSNMIENVWPLERAKVKCCEWNNLPFEKLDFIIGDGSFSQIPYPVEYNEVIEEIHRVLIPGGCLVLRFFTRPEINEEPTKVFSDLKNRKIGNFHIFRFRLAMSLYDNGVKLADVWDAWDNENIKIDFWPEEVLDTINPYKGSDFVYTFPTIREVENSFKDYFECDHAIMNYEFGENCPIFVFKNMK